MRRLTAFLVGLTTAAALASCGEEGRLVASDEPSLSPDPDLPIVFKDGEVQVSCGGGPGWSPSVMADGISGVFTDAEVEAIFRDLLADPQLAPELELSFLSEGAEDTAWRVLAHDESTVTLGLDEWTDEGPVDGAFVMGLEREGEEWTMTGGGNCGLEPILRPGLMWVELGAPHGGLDRANTSLSIEVNERACTGSRDPQPFLHEPAIVENDTSVTVYWTSTPPDGVSTCPGNPSVERTLELAAPLGDRALLDGSVYPPRDVLPTIRSAPTVD